MNFRILTGFVYLSKYEYSLLGEDDILVYQWLSKKGVEIRYLVSLDLVGFDEMLSSFAYSPV